MRVAGGLLSASVTTVQQLPVRMYCVYYLFIYLFI